MVFHPQAQSQVRHTVSRASASSSSSYLSELRLPSKVCGCCCYFHHGCCMTTAYSMEEEHEHTVVVREKLNDFFIVFFCLFSSQRNQFDLKVNWGKCMGNIYSVTLPSCSSWSVVDIFISKRGKTQLGSRLRLCWCSSLNHLFHLSGMNVCTLELIKVGKCGHFIAFTSLKSKAL